LTSYIESVTKKEVADETLWTNVAHFEQDRKMKGKEINTMQNPNVVITRSTTTTANSLCQPNQGTKFLELYYILQKM